MQPRLCNRPVSAHGVQSGRDVSGKQGHRQGHSHLLVAPSLASTAFAVQPVSGRVGCVGVGAWVCMCVCARVCACECVCVCVRVCKSEWGGGRGRNTERRERKREGGGRASHAQERRCLSPCSSPWARAQSEKRRPRSPHSTACEQDYKNETLRQQRKVMYHVTNKPFDGRDKYGSETNNA